MEWAGVNEDDACWIDMSRRKTILVVEDEAGVRRLMERALTEAGYNVRSAWSRNQVLSELSRGTVDLITLDLKLASEDGLEIAREIGQHAAVPIIMVTGSSQPHERVAGLEIGAVDYVTKPFHIKEILIRIRAALDSDARSRKSEENATDRALSVPVNFGQWSIDFRRRRLVHAQDGEVDLTETEFDILALLVKNPSRPISRDEIWLKLRGTERDPLDRTLDGHIVHLRSKLSRGRDSLPAIKSVRGVGYIFCW